MKTGDVIDKPWGWERILDLNDRYCVRHLFARNGGRLSLQYHQRKRETVVLVSGAAELARGGRSTRCWPSTWSRASLTLSSPAPSTGCVGWGRRAVSCRR